MSASPAGRIVRYTEEAVAPLESSQAKAYLVHQGMPEDHLLFRAYSSDEVHPAASPDGRTWLCVGEVGDAEKLCVDVRSGHVADLNDISGEVWHVNASVAQFAQSLAAFAARFPFYPADDDMERKEKAAENLRSVLSSLDPTALEGDAGYWDTILFDVANGDYADE